MKRTEIGTIGEFGLIDRITAKYKVSQKSTVYGIGDDGAVINNSNLQTVVSTDLLVEGIHFDMMYSPLMHLGYKAVVVNLSDIYAMNAIPKQITISLAISSRFSVEAIEELYKGVYAACERYNVDLVGGDTTSSLKGLIISVTAIGQGEKGKIVYRNGAKQNDLICVSGDLGASYMGLQLLEREKHVYKDNPDMQPELEGHDYLLKRQLKPEARKDVIDMFAKAQLVPTAMIDVSDGLASDLMHICKSSDVGAFIEEGQVPIHEKTYNQAIAFSFDPITVALSGGEDYELLFTVDPSDLEKVRFMNDVCIIGDITPKEDGIFLHTKGGNRHRIKAQGWKHFEQ